MRRALGLVLLVVVGVFPGRVIVQACLSWVGQWLALPSSVHEADAIVVLGGNMARIEQGIALYHQGLAPELWHTGDAPPPGSRMPPPASTRFARFAARLAVERGVPAESIHLLATTSTWEDGQEVVALARARNVKSFLVVTDWYHSRRALRVLARQASAGRRAGSQPGTLEGSDAEPAIYYAPSADEGPLGIAYGPENWWRHRAGWAAVLGELLKMCYYTLRYGVAPWYWGG